MIPKATMKLPNEPGIYMITCTANGKIYIGSTLDFAARWRTHKSNLRASRHKNLYLQQAWDSYGEDCFTFTILEKCQRNRLVECEQYYLDTWQPFQDRGFNIATNSQNNMMRGRKHTPEARARMSAAQKGRSHKLSSEQAIKMQAAQKPKYTYIIVTPNEEIVKTNSLNAFAISHGLDVGHMNEVARGERLHHKKWQVKRFNMGDPLIEEYKRQLEMDKERGIPLLLEGKRLERKHTPETKAKISAGVRRIDAI